MPGPSLRGAVFLFLHSLLTPEGVCAHLGGHSSPLMDPPGQMDTALNLGLTVNTAQSTLWPTPLPSQWTLIDILLIVFQASKVNQ